MVTITRPRNSGKTTMLLYYMVIDQTGVYVARTCDNAKQAFNLSRQLGLHLDVSRFVSMMDIINPRGHRSDRCKVLVDDIDCILKCDFINGVRLLSLANVVTISEGE